MTSAYLLADAEHKPLKITKKGTSIDVDLPAKALDPIATVLVLTEFYGLSLEAATGIALVMWINTFVIIVPIGLGLAFHEGIKWRSLRHIDESSSGYGL